MNDMLNSPAAVTIEKDIGTIAGDGIKFAETALATSLGPVGVLLVPFLPEIPKILESLFIHTGQAIPAPLANILDALNKAIV